MDNEQWLLHTVLEWNQVVGGMCMCVCVGGGSQQA